MRIIIINLSFRNKFLTEMPLAKAKIRILKNISAKNIKLFITKVKIVNKVKNIIFDNGFNLCIREFPGV